jgi:hypothetical protein
MKYVLCSLASSILRERYRVDDPEAWKHWAVWCCGKDIEQSAWRELGHWVRQESRGTALPALSHLLEADLPLHPTTEELLDVHQDLAQLEAGALNDRSRAAFEKLVEFLDVAIQHAKDCEGNPRRRSNTMFQWLGEDQCTVTA